jgi:hypothetical protein
MSSCANVAAILSYHKKALFIDEETSGAYEGNNSGMLPQMKVPLLNFIVTVPLQKYFNYVDLSKNSGRGTIPDYPIILSVKDLMKGNDKALNFTLELIKDSSI